MVVLAEGSVVGADQNPRQLRRWKPDGVFDPGYAAPAEFNQEVLGVEGRSRGGGVFAFGQFFFLGNDGFQYGLKVYDEDGRESAEFDLGAGFSLWVQAVEVAPDGRVWGGGDFTTYQGAVHNRIVVLKGEGTPLSVGEGETFGEYATRIGLAGGEVEFGLDGDFDGIGSGVEFLLGSDATVADGKFPDGTFRSGDVLGIAGDLRDYLTWEVRVRRDVSGVEWRVVASSDLATLYSGEVEAVEVGDAVEDGEFDVYRFRCPWPVEDARGHGFLGMEATLSP